MDKRSTWHKMINRAQESETGQSIVILAFAFMGIMAIVGMAIDAAYLFTRMSQFGTAVDDATRAGVLQLRTSDDVNAAYNEAVRSLNLSGWPMADATSSDYKKTETARGAPQFTLTVTWPVAMNFMQLLGFNEVNVTRSATAALVARPELFTPTAFEWGAARKANVFAYGPDTCTANGDPVAPRWKNGSGDPNSEWYIAEGVHQYRIRVDQRYIDEYGPEIRIELFDPGVGNTRVNPDPNEFRFSADYITDFGATTPSLPTCDPNMNLACVQATDEITRSADLQNEPYRNPFWYTRVDEGYGTSQCGGAGGAMDDVPTRFELYYYDTSPGFPRRQTIATYTANATDEVANGTDLKWVTPGLGLENLGGGEQYVHPAVDGGSDFVVDVTTIPTDSNDFRQIYLDVTTLSGHSKNVFDVWARPPNNAPNWDETLPLDINQRNLHILDDADARTGKYDVVGADTFALGRLPLNPYMRAGGWTDAGEVPFTMVPVDGELSVTAAYGQIFDYDGANTGTTGDYEVYLNLGDGNVSHEPSGSFSIDCPSGSCDNVWTETMTVNPLSFGLLIMEYRPGEDEHVWSMVLTTGAQILTK
ncbi:MAG: hypothetical protein R3248_12385 [Candidatus Promineifilaceae bacterium]|nr:hypothetical protein [Candidatus Promineifilaceae bacterium]